jgi:adenylate cyclase
LKSLQQRLIVFLLLPVALVLLLTGILSFIYIRNSMLNETKTIALLSVEQAAHRIDMQLSRPFRWIDMFHNTSGTMGEYAVQSWLLERMREREGVVEVNLEWTDKSFKDTPMPMMKGQGFPGKGRTPMRFHRGRISGVTSPYFNEQSGEETFSIVSHFVNKEGEVVGKLEVVMSFNYLMREIRLLNWWKSDMIGGLVDESGKILAKTRATGKNRTRLGETNDPLELSVLDTMDKKPFGIVLGPELPPKSVGGFYKISRVPWTFVAFSSGQRILSPIIKFRNYYALIGGLSLVLILVLIRFVTGGMVRRIREISKSAQRVSEGDYGEPLSVRGEDEIGQLTQSFNTMIDGLKERDFISNTFGRYVDQRIARELMKQPEAARLGGDRREVAIFMSDIRGFTSLSETLDPEVIISIVNRYFSRLIDIIQKHEGIIVDFFGDGILVFFDPLDGPVEPKVHNAVQCALEIQSRMEDFNAEMKAEGLPELKTGIGINAGEVIVGNIGSETRAKYGIVGSAVNITQRIQSEAKGGNVVISESAYCCLSENLIIEKSFSVPLKGLQKPMTLYEVKGLKSQK